MNTGLPGTGIRGLFYMFSVFVMIFIEIKDIIFRRKNGYSKAIVLEQTIIIFLLIVAIYTTNIFFSKYVFKKPPIYLAVNANLSAKASYVVTNYPILVPLALLIIVLIFTQALYVFLKSSKNERDTGVEPVSSPWKGDIEPLN